MTDREKTGSAEPETTKSEYALREEKVLEFWKEGNIFEKTLEKNSPLGEFVFYEGPPTANAAPALHHLESRAFKDAIPRYKTMRGYHVRRKGGWDTHGLPVELQIEKKLGLTSKKQIEEYGIAAFNRACRQSVWEYIGAWDAFTERIGYWVDEKEPYVTYHNAYIESLWNIVARVNEKGLLYKDYKVVPWCPRCGTALSSHELAQGYQDITDISVYVKFKVKNQKAKVKSESQNEKPEYILAWTTTPWTLPGNVGLAVNPEIDYVKITESGRVTVNTPESHGKYELPSDDIYIIAKDLFAKEDQKLVPGNSSSKVYHFDGKIYEIIEEMKGVDLVGLEYEPLYPFLEELASGQAREALPRAFKVYPADFVTTEDGTGIVHTAVMYGQEDFELGTKIGLPKFHLVALDGTFIPGTGFLEGKYVRTEETAVEIIKDLSVRGLLFKKEKYKHSYPHCWRCKTALIYYARDSWYIAISKLREDLKKENEKILWEPAHIKEGRFGEWLREAKDWAISRERYWGTPLPVWESETGERAVISSMDDLKSLIGRRNTYYLVRHGESESNVSGDRISCKKDNTDPLTETGRSNAKMAGETLAGKGIDLIISSPFQRTRETAEIIAEKIGYEKTKIIYRDEVGEINAGEYNGKPWSEYLDSFLSPSARFEKRADGYESWEDARRRVMKFLYETDAEYEGKTILIVGHGGPLNLARLGSRGYSREEIIRHYYDNPIMNGEVMPCDFAALPHDEDYVVDLHRPYIDEVIVQGEDGKLLRRVNDVMDVWFDSGAMPFAQDHYPFENEAWVDGAGYPADFISEAIDQTRGWFYTLLAVGVLLGRGTPYKNVICLGHILDKDGKKMSKSVGNIVNPWEMMDKYGTDALRLWMYSVNQPGDSKNFDEKTVDEIVKKIFNPLTNVLTLLSTYRADAKPADPRASRHPLDRWIIARLGELVLDGTEKLDAFKLFEPMRDLRDFVQDFSAWYIRRSRERLKSTDPAERDSAVAVTEYVLTELSKFMAPFAPFYAEWLYKEVTRGERLESVHLEIWPEYPATSEEDNQLLEAMKRAREIVTVALELRQKAGIKVRQPLANLKIKNLYSAESVGNRQNVKLGGEVLGIIADELNVKQVEIDDSVEGEAWLDTDVTPELKEEGVVRDIIRGIQDARKKENLSPNEKVSLMVEGGEEVRKIFDKFADTILVPTGVEKVEFSEEKQKHEINLENIRLSVSVC